MNSALHQSYLHLSEYLPYSYSKSEFHPHGFVSDEINVAILIVITSVNLMALDAPPPPKFQPHAEAYENGNGINQCLLFLHDLLN